MSTVRSFRDSWSIWHPLIEENILHQNSGRLLFDLGDSLSQIFRSNVRSGRDQGILSGGGTAWECLIVWYLNLVFWETPVIAVRYSINFVPSVISNCVTVTISNHATNTESDIVIFSVPDLGDFSGTNVDDLDLHIKARLSLVDFVVLQCKTNWNDNSQVPMLWDLVYNSEVDLPFVSLGIEGVNTSSVNSFKYAFVTVPSNQNSNINPNSICVLRVKNLTGGNYWGKQTQQGCGK